MKRAPFGYKVEINQHGGKKYAVDPKEADILEAIFFMCFDGHSCLEIASYLNAQKSKTRNKQPFNTLSIASILKNPFYIGFDRERENGRTYLVRFRDEEYEPFINTELWVDAQISFKNYETLKEVLPISIIREDIRSLDSSAITQIIERGYESYILKLRREWEELRI